MNEWRLYCGNLITVNILNMSEAIMGMEYRQLDLTVTNENIISDAKNLLNILCAHWDENEIIIKVRV